MDATYKLILPEAPGIVLKAAVLIPKKLPTSLELNDYKYNSSIVDLMSALTSLSYDLEEILYPNEKKGFDLINDALPPGAILKKLLVYSCSTLTSYFYSYGGYIIEYKVDSITSTIIVLRGTQYLCEWYENSKALLTSTDWLPRNITVHTGFNNIYNSYKSPVGSLRTQIMNYLNSNTNINNIIITGHSLGAGLGMLLFADIKNYKPSLSASTKFYGFATPAVGNRQFSNLLVPNRSAIFTGIFKIINVQDPVAATTPPFYDRVPSQLFCFLDKVSGVSNSHFLKTYSKGIADNYNIFNQNKNKQLGGISCVSQIL